MRSRVGRSGLLAVAVLVASAGLAACGGGGPTAVIGVDHSHDEFPASMIDFFPDTVVVHPGDTVRFRQRWTGEPHSVTFGALFNDELGTIRERLREPLPPTGELPGLDAIEALPVMLGRDGEEFVVNQNGAQPCYLEEGAPPSEPDVACPRRSQPK